jgi:hypothetical protein
LQDEINQHNNHLMTLLGDALGDGAYGEGGGGLDVQEGGASKVDPATALNFNADDFDITDEGGDVAGIVISSSKWAEISDLDAYLLLAGGTLEGALVIEDGGLDIQHSGASAILDHDAYNLSWRNAAVKSVLIGYNAGLGCTVTNNVVIGPLAGEDLVSGQRNVIVGYAAGWNTTGTGNTYVGARSARYNVAGGSNTCIGYLSGGGSGATYSNTVIVGSAAGNVLTTGNNNLLFGYNAGASLTTGVKNILIGGGPDIVDGDSNVSIGSGSNDYVVSGDRNIGIGTQANRFQLGSDNIGIGTWTLYASSGASGDGNVAIGDEAGRYCKGSRNIYLGRDAGFYQVDTDDTLIIDNRKQASEAAELTNAIIVGVMNGTPSSQILTVNADLIVTYDLDHDGSNVGFYGTAPIAQAVLATGVGASVDDVITALQNLGLVKQS